MQPQATRIEFAKFIFFLSDQYLSWELDSHILNTKTCHWNGRVRLKLTNLPPGPPARPPWRKLTTFFPPLPCREITHFIRIFVHCVYFFFFRLFKFSFFLQPKMEGVWPGQNFWVGRLYARECVCERDRSVIAANSLISCGHELGGFINKCCSYKT